MYNVFTASKDTYITNKIINEALNKKLIKKLADFDSIKPEQKFGSNTRFDFLLNSKNHFIARIIFVNNSQLIHNRVK